MHTVSETSQSCNSRDRKASNIKRKGSTVTDMGHQHMAQESEIHISVVNGPPSKKTKLRSPATSRNTTTEVDADTVKASPKVEKPEDVPFNRPAEPYSTNAPLRTPRGSGHVACPSKIGGPSPSKPGGPVSTMTTGTILDEACNHLIRVDPRLQPLILKHYCHTFSTEGLAEVVDPFRNLCSGIMAQQVSGPAAKAIKNRFIGLFRQAPAEDAVFEEDFFPTPAQIATCEVSYLRQAGLSGRKVEYIKGLAEKFASSELSAAMLIKATDEEVMDRLTAIRGLGKWSVEMFACFGLKRMDVFSTGDLGVQ